MTGLFKPITDAERLRSQLRVGHLMLDLLHHACREDLPPVTWTIAHAGASVVIRCDTRAKWQAWVAATGVTNLWRERRHSKCTHLHADGDLPTSHGGAVHMAIVADLDTTFDEAAVDAPAGAETRTIGG